MWLKKFYKIRSNIKDKLIKYNQQDLLRVLCECYFYQLKVLSIEYKNIL